MSALPQFVCASANPDKVTEIQALLAGVVDLLPRPAAVPDVVEDADGCEAIEVEGSEAEDLADGDRDARDTVDVAVDVFDHAFHRRDQRVHVPPAVIPVQYSTVMMRYTCFRDHETVGSITRL